MKTAIQKWGNSLGVRLPASLAQAALLKSGDEVEFLVSKKGITLVPTGCSTFQSRCEAITDVNKHTVTDWGTPRGVEIW